jgi:hypothetical protein
MTFLPESVSFPESGVLNVQCCFMLVILTVRIFCSAVCSESQSGNFRQDEAVEMSFTRQEAYLAIHDGTRR